MFQIELTLLPSYKTALGRRIEGDLRKIIGTSHVITEDKDRQAVFTPATFHNNYRNSESLIKNTALVYDADDVQIGTLARVTSTLTNIKFCLYTTFSHDPQKTGLERWRLIIFVNRSLSSTEFRQVYPYVAEELLLSFDNSSADSVHAFLVPSTTSERASSAQIIFNEGQSLNVDVALARATKKYSTVVSSYRAPLVPTGNSTDFALLKAVCSQCAAAEKLCDIIANGSPARRERFRFAQLCLALGYAEEYVVAFFSQRYDFVEKVARYQVHSITKRLRNPSCRKLSEDLRFCDGNCSTKNKLKISSPTQIKKGKIYGEKK